LESHRPARALNFQHENAETVNVLDTVKNYILTNKFEIKTEHAISKAAIQILFLIDSSGSMVKDKQIAYIKGVIQQTIEKYKATRLKYAAVSLSHGDAKLLCPLTFESAELYGALEQLKTGGKTNMKAGFNILKDLVKSRKADAIHLTIFTDGKINAGETKNPFEEAITFYKTFLKSVNEVTVIDTEKSFIKLGLSEKLANSIGAKYRRLNTNN
jgi:magnesium chelatase subunit ChlD-like protein